MRPPSPTQQTFGEWVDSMLLPPKLVEALQQEKSKKQSSAGATPPTTKVPTSATTTTTTTTGNWLDRLLLLPPQQEAADISKKECCDVVKEKDNKSSSSPPTSDPFCSIPDLLKINICCAETVETTKGADDQSHSTISENGILQDELEQQQQQQQEATPSSPDLVDTTVSKPTTNSSFQTWQKFFADWNNSICGNPPNMKADGLPPTINIATPIKQESSLITLDEKKSLQAGEQEGSSKDQEEQSGDPLAATKAVSIMDKEEEGDEDKPAATTEEEGADAAEEENETVVNETIVIYYTDSGSSADGNKKADLDDDDDDDDDDADAPASPIVQTVVRVALDPILQERADCEIQEDGYKTPCVSMTNVEGESTGAMSPTSPVRFQNLATGSFCEVASDSPDAAKEEGSRKDDEAPATKPHEEEVDACKTTSVATEELRPLVEVEETNDDDDEDEEKKEEREEEAVFVLEDHEEDNEEEPQPSTEEEALIDEVVKAEEVHGVEEPEADKVEEDLVEEEQQEQVQSGEAEKGAKDELASEEECVKEKEEDAEAVDDLRAIAIVHVEQEQEGGEEENEEADENEAENAKQNIPSESLPRSCENAAEEEPREKKEGLTADDDGADVAGLPVGVEVESTGTIIKIVSLFVGVFDSPEEAAT